MASPTHTPRRRGPETLFAATLSVVFVIAQLTDQWAFHHFTYPGIYERGWGRLLRIAGYLPVWALVALALLLHDCVPRARPPPAPPSPRPLLPFSSPPIAGT